MHNTYISMIYDNMKSKVGMNLMRGGGKWVITIIEKKVYKAVEYWLVPARRVSIRSFGVFQCRLVITSKPR